METKSDLLKMRRLIYEPMNPSHGSFFRLRTWYERVAGDEHAEAERHELDAGSGRRSLASDQVQQARRLLFRQPGVKYIC